MVALLAFLSGPDGLLKGAVGAKVVPLAPEVHAGPPGAVGSSAHAPVAAGVGGDQLLAGNLLYTGAVYKVNSLCHVGLSLVLLQAAAASHLAPGQVLGFALHFLSAVALAPPEHRRPPPLLGRFQGHQPPKPLARQVQSTSGPGPSGQTATAFCVPGEKVPWKCQEMCSREIPKI